MKRSDILKKLGFQVPEQKIKRVILLTDVKNEADDPYAIVHHLLTPTEDVRGIISCHFEQRARDVEEMLRQGAHDAVLAEQKRRGLILERGASEGSSYDEAEKLLKLMEIDDVPLVHGSAYELNDPAQLPDSAGADFIIEEALREDTRPLYVALLGAATDMAIALRKAPEIAKRLTVVWIGGGAYPEGGEEFNFNQDVNAAKLLFESEADIWQIPCDVYRTMEVSLSELAQKVRPCGAVGRYLFDELTELNGKLGYMGLDAPFPHGETWPLGDNPSVSVLLMGRERMNYRLVPAPSIDAAGRYVSNPTQKEMRVYEDVDPRLTLEDFFAKLRLCYGV